MPLSRLDRIKYLTWAALQNCRPMALDCPGCRSTNTRLLRRKYIATAVRECQDCWLRFRTPKDGNTEAFYQQDYVEGFTTDLPPKAVLQHYQETRFQNTQKDFSRYIELLHFYGLSTGDAVLDFGSSWGYGSWQMRSAGFDVYSYEISRPRAEYARDRLGCRMVEDPSGLTAKVRCLFSAHVIEHLPDPNIIWTTARTVLSEGGFIACFCPNGNPDLELNDLARYDRLWGKVHPLLITPTFLRNTCVRHGFDYELRTSPYTPENSLLVGDEICLIARKRADKGPIFNSCR